MNDGIVSNCLSDRNEDLVRENNGKCDTKEIQDISNIEQEILVGKL